MRKRVLFVIFMSVIIGNVHSQISTYGYHIIVDDNLNVHYDSIVAKKDTIHLDEGAIIEYQKEYKIGDVSYIATIKDTLRKDAFVYASSTEKQTLNKPGKATITIDEDDNSKFHINYYLRKDVIDNRKYYFTLENRQYYKFKFSANQIGALTIPYKIRPSWNKNDTTISEALTTELNLGVYFSRTWGTVTYMYRRLENKKPTKWLNSLGVFANISKVEIDSLTTISSENQLKKDEKKDIGVFSFGIGYMMSIYEVRLGVYIGMDLGIGEFGRRWDYHQTPWFGIGFGYNLKSFWPAAD